MDNYLVIDKYDVTSKIQPLKDYFIEKLIVLNSVLRPFRTNFGFFEILLSTSSKKNNWLNLF